MNAHTRASDLAQTMRFGADFEGSGQPGRGPGLAVDALIAVTALVSPALIGATGWLYGGELGLAVSMTVAVATYAGLVLHDWLFVRAAGDGARQTAELLLRGVIPLAGTTLLSVPVLLKVFSGDIEQVEVQRLHAVVAPATQRIALAIDAETASERTILAALRSERAGLDARRSQLERDVETRLSAERVGIAAASEEVREQTLLLQCEDKGLRCVAANTGRAGLDGPVSGRAEALRRAASEEVAARKEVASRITREHETALAPIADRLGRLDAPSGPDSIAAAQARVDARSSGRDALIARRVSLDPDVAAASAPPGLGGRLITLLTIVVQQPAILMLMLAAKAFLTVFELLGTICGLRAARAARSVRLGFADDDARKHARRLGTIMRRRELVLARIASRRAIWAAERDLDSDQTFHRFNGMGASLRRAMGATGSSG